MIPRPATSVAPPVVRLHIERLVLDGTLLPSGQCREFQAALTAELERRLAVPGTPPTLCGNLALKSVDGGEVSLARAALSQSIAAQLTRTLHTGLRQ